MLKMYKQIRKILLKAGWLQLVTMLS